MVKENAILRPLTPDEEQLARMFKALGNPVRFQIVQILAEKQTCITGEIVEFTTLAQSTVSQHLKVLVEASLIKGAVEGPAVCYCLNETSLAWLKARLGQWLPGCCAAAAASTDLAAPAGTCCE